MLGKGVIYPALRAEMARRQLGYDAIQVALGVSCPAVSLKLRGKRKFTLSEAKQIRDTLFPDMGLDDLFGEEDKD